MASRSTARLLAQFAVATQQAATDRRALLAEALYSELGSDVAVAAAVTAHEGRTIGRGTIEQLRRRARDEVHTDPARRAAALTLGGPISTNTTDRKAADLASLRRTAQQLRDDRQLGQAVELEAIIRGREAESA